MPSLRELADLYPPPLRSFAHESIGRMAFNLRLIETHLGGIADQAVCDLGGGTSLLSLALGARGARAFLVDDFQDPQNLTNGTSVLDLHRSYGVEVIQADLLKFDATSIAPLDAVTSFDSMEHWHDSPRQALQHAVEALRPGGLLIIGVPNNANARKRAMALAGKTDWSPFEEWWDLDSFRGHVREPRIADLARMAAALGLTDARIFGRNWLGYGNHRPWRRTVTPLVDRALRLRPALCSDIYLAATKPL